MINKEKVIEGATLLLQGLGVDLMDHNFSTTPQRMLKVYQELFEPPETEWPVFDENYTDVVMMRGHVFYTLCPHHMLPVKLTATVAYIPNGKVIGASKLIRMIHECNTSPMTQEALTDSILRSIKHLTRGSSLGEAVFLIGEHGCFSIRGVKSHANMITYKFAGEFETNMGKQNRFMSLIMMRAC